MPDSHITFWGRGIASMLALGLSRPWLLPLVILLQYLGLQAERWFFFAEANQQQNLYYQVIS